MITLDLSIESYLASKRASHHKLKKFASLGPRGYYIAVEQKRHTEEDTKAFLAGRATEDALQRPAEFATRYVAKPAGMSYAKTEGKEWRTAQEAKGLTILDSDDARAIEQLMQTLDACPVARHLMDVAQAQPTILHDESHMWPDLPGIQSRPDWMCLDGCAASEWRPYVLDLKTTRTLGELASGRSIVKYGYHRQAAMVRMCLEMDGMDVRDLRYLLLGAEKTFPFRWRVIEVPTRLIDTGERWCVEQLDLLQAHYASGEWPLVQSEIVMADVPAWLDESEAA